MKYQSNLDWQINRRIFQIYFWMFIIISFPLYSVKVTQTKTFYPYLPLHSFLSNIFFSSSHLHLVLDLSVTSPVQTTPGLSPQTAMQKLAAVVSRVKCYYIIFLTLIVLTLILLTHTGKQVTSKDLQALAKYHKSLHTSATAWCRIKWNPNKFDRWTTESFEIM